jgi:translation initiation factor IF-3
LSISTTKRARRNEEIDSREVRLIGAKGEQLGVHPTDEAMRNALDAGLDLVEVAPNAEPPVCRIMDYGKYLFELNKKAHSAKRKQKQIQVKEVKLRPGTGEGDYQVKLRNLVRFLSGGDKAKVTMRFRGREMVHQELGVQVLHRVQADLADIAIVEQHPKLEGRQMVMVFGPKKK